MKKGLIFIIAVVIVLGGYALLSNTDKTGNEDPSNEEEWVTHQNSKYKFSIDHPSDWLVWEGEQFGTPIVNIYKKGASQQPPYIHHSNVTQVSIFPNGVPTEGVNVESTTTQITLASPATIGLDFLLGDKTAFATMFSGFTTKPSSWNTFGFIWASVEIPDLKQYCISDGVEHELALEEVCETLGREPETLVYRGSINKDDREIETKMLESFTFNTQNND